MVSWTALRKSLGGSNVAKSTTIDATLSGLRARPADPLILCINVDGRPLRGLSAQVDWRLAGLLSKLARKGFASDVPILRPAHKFLPCGRLVLFRAGACTPREMAQQVAGLNGRRPGLCPQDFDFTIDEVNQAFGGNVIIYATGDQKR